VMTEGEIAARLGRFWQVVLPGVYATFTGALSEPQRARAALLHAGTDSMLSDLSALALYRIRYLPVERCVRVLVAATVQRSSRDFVVVRRTKRLPRPYTVAGLAVAPPHRALCEFILRWPDERTSLAVAASVVQLGKASLDQLLDEAKRGPARGRPRLVRVLGALRTGVLSVPEDDFRRLVSGSDVLPAPLFNARLVLGSGKTVMADALFMDSGLIHETNGRDVHAGPIEFDEMQRRHDLLTAAGFTVLHNTPRRLRDHGAQVLAEVEGCHARLSGRGLPAGAKLLE